MKFCSFGGLPGAVARKGRRVKILSVIGTRPEAIKMAPVLMDLRARADITSLVCATGQHREVVDQALEALGVRVDVNLAIMEPGQSLNAIVQRVVSGVDALLREAKPDRVLVHGDTSTALAAAMAAFNHGTPTAHVEAGLRSFDPARPWPEEMNRRALDVLCDVLFAPTESARQNLAAEQNPGRIVVTGNTGIDALQRALARIEAEPALRMKLDADLPAPIDGRRLLLVTGHRRENLGEGLQNVSIALERLSHRSDLQIAYVLHPNPAAQQPVRRRLEGLTNVHILPPQPYLSSVRLLQRADVVLTDSGGVQEEAPVLGAPVLLTRTETERQEGVAAGQVRLVGTDVGEIEAEVIRLLLKPARPRATEGLRSPYGDGRASERIVRALMGETVDEFSASDVARLDLEAGRSSLNAPRQTMLATEKWSR